MMSIPYKFILPLIFLLLFTQSAERDHEKMQVSGLIDGLVNMDTQGVGLHPTAWTVGFIAEDSTPEFGGGILGSAPPVVYSQLKI